MLGLDPQQVTVIALLLTIGAAGLKRMWVFGWMYTDKTADLAKMEEDRDFWRDIALKALGHADRAIDVATEKRWPHG